MSHLILVLLLLKHGVENHAPILKLAVGSNLLPISQQEIFGEADDTSSSTDNYVTFQAIIHDAKLGVGFCWQNPKRSIFYMAFRLFYFCYMHGWRRACYYVFWGFEHRKNQPGGAASMHSGFSVFLCAPTVRAQHTLLVEYVLLYTLVH